MSGFDPSTYSDRTLIEAIKSLRQCSFPHLGTWPQKRLAVLEREARRRNILFPKHSAPRP